ncbi:MAG: formate hydrogenlyase [Deltaproteobacteria bacterium]|nr:formate hydrogenlyase [Deltaproteobacteria bacterium]
MQRALPHALMLLVAICLYVLSSRQIRRAILAFAVQSFVLAFVSLVAATRSEHPYELWILAGLTIVIKGVVVPLALLRAVSRLKIRHEIEFILNIPSSLLMAAVATLGAFQVAQRVFGQEVATLRGALGAGMATILLGLVVMLGRRKVITQIVGLLIMENGVILAALGLTMGMPLIVEIGVALDVLVAVQILALFAYRISSDLGVGDDAPREGEGPP